MELGEVMLVKDTGTKVAVSALIGAWLACALYLVVRNPWFAVLGCGTVLGRVLLMLWEAEHELRARLDDITELEKQVVAIRAAMHEMCVMNNELETVNRKLAFQRRSKSANSF
jgi:hypothetical protein